MISEHGNYKCDFCGGETGQFHDDTGNHVECQDRGTQLADLREAVEAARYVIDVYKTKAGSMIGALDDLAAALAKLEAK
jgi:hypothetical protein